jgi:hypothetical protein
MVRKIERSIKFIILSEHLKKSNWSVSPQFCLFVIGVNQFQKHVIILKTKILNGRLIRISNLRRDVRGTFQRASPVSEFHVRLSPAAEVHAIADTCFKFRLILR